MSSEPRLAALRRHISFVIVAAIVPAVLLAMAIMGYDYYSREREREVRDSLAMARAMAAAVDAELNGVKSALFALSTSPYLEADDLAAFHRQASAALKDQGFSNIAMLDGELRQQLNTFRPFGTPLPVQGGPESLKRVFSSGQPVVTDLFTGPVLKEPLVAVGVPVRRDGAVRYLLGAAITPERLSRILSQQQLPRDWISAIFDRSGTIVARTHEADRYVGRRGAPELVQRMAQAREGVLETRTLEDIPVVSVFSHSPVSGWSVAVGIPVAYFNSHLLYSLARIFIISFIMLAVAIALAVLLVRRVTG
jgi:hypothetical protein